VSQNWLTAFCHTFILCHHGTLRHAPRGLCGWCKGPVLTRSRYGAFSRSESGLNASYSISVFCEVGQLGKYVLLRNTFRRGGLLLVYCYLELTFGRVNNFQPSLSVDLSCGYHYSHGFSSRRCYIKRHRIPSPVPDLIRVLTTSCRQP
jgi:hypothetical protein